MVELINDFSTFSNFLLLSMSNILNWLTTNPIGEILYFIIIIAISMSIIDFIVKLKQV